MKQKTFVQAVADQEARFEDLDDWIDYWHDNDVRLPLHEFLGLDHPDDVLRIQDREILDSFVARS